MRNYQYQKFLLVLSGFIGSSAIAGLPLTDTSLNSMLNLKQNCTVQNNSVGTLEEAFACGSVHGSIRGDYFSLNHAYFSPVSQDTASIGGYIKYETAPLYGVQAGISYDLQSRLDSKGNHAEVSELKEDRDGLAEAYLTWKNDKARVTVGNQRLDLPFVGDYADWRVLPVVYQGVDAKYGNNTDFVRLTKVNKFKSYADDEFTKTSRQSSTISTDGMWSLGGGKSTKLANGSILKGQLWLQGYEDYTDIIYAQGSMDFPKQAYKPELAVQYINGKDQGKAYAGKVDSQIAGIQLTAKPTPTVNVTAAYDYIRPKKDAYLNGALLTPYAHNTSSGPIFAQPMFTSTQDLGAGNAVMLSAEKKLNAQTILGARYSFMDLKESDDVKSRNQSEYLLYGIYNFDGKLKGLSLADFAGVQVSPRYDHKFLQNRLVLAYNF